MSTPEPKLAEAASYQAQRDLSKVAAMVQGKPSGKEKASGMPLSRNSRGNADEEKHVNHVEPALKKRRSTPLVTSSLEPQVVKLQHPWYLGLDGHDLFVRRCILDVYGFIFHAVEQHRRNPSAYIRSNECTAFILTGPPGIGKSWSSNVIVWLLVRRRQPLWFHSASERTVVTVRYDEEGLAVVDVHPESWLDQEQPAYDTWFLYDSAGSDSSSSSHVKPFGFQLPGVYCIIFSSPKDSNYRYGVQKMLHYGAGGSVKYCWIPAWERNEMQGDVLECWFWEAGLHQSQTAQDSTLVTTAYTPSLDPSIAGISGVQDEDSGVLDEDMLNEDKKADGVVLPDVEKDTLDDFRKFTNDLYDLWGGMPRRFKGFWCTYRERGRRAALFEAELLAKSELAVLAPHLLGGIAEHRFMSPPSWLVVPHPIASTQFQQCVYRFCSRRVELWFLDLVVAAGTSAVAKFCRSMFAFRGAQGIVVEQFFHFVLTRTEQQDFRWKQYGNLPVQKITLPQCTSWKCDMNSPDAFQRVVIGCIEANGSVVIVPEIDQQDAIGMFVVAKLENKWRVLAMQDTIGKTHSFHPVKILEYRAQARAAFLAASVDVRDDFFLHVIVVPRESDEDAFRLLAAEAPRPVNLDVAGVRTMFEQSGLDMPASMSHWTVELAKEALTNAKVKNRNKLAGNDLLVAGAHSLFVTSASAKVTGLTWVLDGLWD